MKTKLIFLTLVSIAVLWGCGGKKPAEDSTQTDTTKVTAAVDTLIDVISLPDLGIQSLLKSAKDSTKKEWKENMVKLRGLNKTVHGKKMKLRMMLTCCPCVGGAGCCLCSKDTTKNAQSLKSEIVMLAAPKEVTQLDLVLDSKPGTTTSLKPEEVDGLHVFTIKRGIENGKYSLRMKGDFKGGEMKCYVEIRKDAIELISRE